MSNLPDWYDPQNFNDAGLSRSVLDVGEFEIEFEYEPGDRETGIPSGWLGVVFTLKSGALDFHLAFDADVGDLATWALSQINANTAGESGRRVVGCRPPDAQHLGDFPALLKIAQDKFDAIMQVEREADDALALALDEERYLAEDDLAPQQEEETHAQAEHEG